MVFYFWNKWKLFKGKPTEMQGRKARRGTDIFWQVSFLYAKNEYENWQGQVLCIQIKVG